MTSDNSSYLKLIQYINSINNKYFLYNDFNIMQNVKSKISWSYLKLEMYNKIL